MKIDVTSFFLYELRQRNSKLARRILRWFERNEWSAIILQCGICWLDPLLDYDWVPAYVKRTVDRFMARRYHAEFIEYPLPPAA